MEVEELNEKFTQKNLALRLLEKAAHGLLVEEDLNDPEIEEQRRRTCIECEFYNQKSIACMACGCFLATKTKSLVNINITTGESEITHCPHNYWEDEFSKSYFLNKT